MPDIYKSTLSTLESFKAVNKTTRKILTWVVVGGLAAIVGGEFTDINPPLETIGYSLEASAAFTYLVIYRHDKKLEKRLEQRKEELLEGIPS